VIARLRKPDRAALHAAGCHRAESQVSSDPESNVQVVRTESLMATLELLSSGISADAAALNASLKAAGENDFSGLIAIQPGRVMVCSGLGVESDHSLSLTPPMIVRFDRSASPDRAVRQLVEAAGLEASRTDCRRLRCLLPDNADAQLPLLLKQCGFRTVSHVSCWVASSGTGKPMTDQNAEQSAVRVAELTDAAESAAAVSELLSAIIEESDDLQQLPAPDAGALISGWRARQSKIICAYNSNEAVGVAVVSQNAVSHESSSDGTHHSARAGRRTDLEYIGVRPGWRRHGVANAIARHVFAMSQDQSKPERDVADVAAFVDEQNTPAIEWYRQAGFRRESISRLFVRDLAGSSES